MYKTVILNGNKTWLVKIKEKKLDQWSLRSTEETVWTEEERSNRCMRRIAQ
jgi:hypothetical protein